MSEFTNGILFLNQYTEEMRDFAQIFQEQEFVTQFIEHWRANNSNAVSWLRNRFDGRKHLEYIVHHLNDKWTALLIEDYVFSLTYAPTYNWLKDASKVFPILVFNDAEDHGWNYYLFTDGVLVSKVEVAYDLEWNMVYDLLDANYPQLRGDPVALFEVENVQDYYKKVQESEAYHQAIDDMYRYHYAEKFKVFDVSDENIKRLKNEITSDKYRVSNVPTWDQVEKFKEVLQFKEATWMSYRYLKKEQDEDE